VKGDPAERRRFLDELLSPGPPGTRECGRLRAGAQATRRVAQDGRARLRRAVAPGTSAPSTCGRAPRPARWAAVGRALDLVADLRRCGGRVCRGGPESVPVAARTAARSAGRCRRSRCPNGRRADPEVWKRDCWYELARTAPGRSTAGVSLVGRIATSWNCCWASVRPGVTPVTASRGRTRGTRLGATNCYGRRRGTDPRARRRVRRLDRRRRAGAGEGARVRQCW